jgi:hypothetical protein
MSNFFTFQVETAVTLDQASLEVEGRCCEGYIREGDCFTECIVRTRDENGEFTTEFTSVVLIKVRKVISIRPDLLGIGETGTLILDTASTENLNRDNLLRGHRS